MSTEVQERRLVRRLAVSMREKLAKYRHRADWRDEQVVDLLSHLREEVEELVEAMASRQEPAEVWREAADIGNLAAMVADWYETRATP